MKPPRRKPAAAPARDVAPASTPAQGKGPRPGAFNVRRGYEDFAARLGPDVVSATFDERLAATGGRARVLEIGCGEGRLLLDLAKRFPTIELHGVNKRPWQAMQSSESLYRVAQESGVFDRAALAARGLPAVHFFNAQNLQFPDAHFDLIVSQVAIPYVKRKDWLLSGIWRTLAPGGRALLNLDVSSDELPDFLDGETPRFRLLRDGAPYATSAWVDDLAARGFEVRFWMRPDARGNGKTWANLEIVRNRAEPLDLGLRHDPLSSFNLRRLYTSENQRAVFWGHRSVFRVKSPPG